MNKQIRKIMTKNHDLTYIDCPLPINNLGSSKTVDFGQAQPLW